jgi:pimeloyl-ACP methyl ester carboxylesterase
MTSIWRMILFLDVVSPLAADVTAIRFIPRTTDSQIGETYNSPHFIYVDRDIVVENNSRLPSDRHQLLVFLAGTNGTGGGATAFCSLAAELGYHVINLTYPTGIAASICTSDADPKAFEDFRMTIIQGGKSPHLTVEKADSIENRLAKLLRHLEPLRPREDWGQFLNKDGSLKWETIAVAGQSQGGGHAALIAIKHRVARVICTGAPKDYSRRLEAPAAWYGEKSATPKACFFAFNHTQDPQGCTPAQLLRNFAALGLDVFGAPVDVTAVKFPFAHTRILLTSYPVVPAPVIVDNENAIAAHSSVIKDANAARWKQVWTYLLTEKVQ